MVAITISRQLGSQGREIASLVAIQLGYRMVWRDLINQAARRAGAPEAALAAIDELGLLGICPSPSACQAYRQAVAQVISELAEAGEVVILGRAGQIILAGHPDILHVRLVAPLQVRADRIALRYNITNECALAQIQASDANRAKYLRRFYNVRWDDPQHYHLVLNTGLLSLTQATEIICSSLNQIQSKPLTKENPQEDRFDYASPQS